MPSPVKRSFTRTSVPSARSGDRRRIVDALRAVRVSRGGLDDHPAARAATLAGSPGAGRAARGERIGATDATSDGSAPARGRRPRGSQCTVPRRACERASRAGRRASRMASQRRARTVGIGPGGKSGVQYPMPLTSSIVRPPARRSITSPRRGPWVMSSTPACASGKRRLISTSAKAASGRPPTSAGRPTAACEHALQPRPAGTRRARRKSGSKSQASR